MGHSESLSTHGMPMCSWNTVPEHVVIDALFLRQRDYYIEYSLRICMIAKYIQREMASDYPCAEIKLTTWNRDVYEPSDVRCYGCTFTAIR